MKITMRVPYFASTSASFVSGFEVCPLTSVPTGTMTRAEASCASV
jgi:hypothetical protein